MVLKSFTLTTPVLNIFRVKLYQILCAVIEFTNQENIENINANHYKDYQQGRGSTAPVKNPRQLTTVIF